MWKHILVFYVMACGVVLGFFDKIINKGKWAVQKLEKCENHESYPYDLDLRKKKLNRTHDVFFAEFELMEDLTEDDFGVYIVGCKKVDGGCKVVVTFDEDSVCKFFIKHAADNFKKLLRNIGTEEHCPIPKGHYKLEDFLFDNTELPEEGLVGSFIATFTILKHKIEKMACFTIHLHFDED